MAGAIAAVALTGAFIVALIIPFDAFCDGTYERWRLPDDYRGGGCPEVTPAIHGIFPWNWHDRDLVCTGMCLNTLQPNQGQPAPSRHGPCWHTGVCLGQPAPWPRPDRGR